MAADLICPCLRRRHRVAPSPVKSPDMDYVDVAAGAHTQLRVLHVLPRGRAGADAASPPPPPPLTSDFWFNHWQGPHITAAVPARRKTSTNTFGPADAVGRARKTSMTAQVSPAEIVVRQLLEDALQDVFRRCVVDRPPPAPAPLPPTLEESGDDTDGGGRARRRARDVSAGIANVAYEPSADDPEEAAVRLPDATTGETDTEEEEAAAARPPPAPQPARRASPPQQQQQQRAAGGGRLPLLFFLHGVGGSAEVWTPQIKHFSALGYECVAPDLLGHGFSSAPGSARHYSFASMMQHVRDVFRRYATSRRRVVVIGHSYGASFACVLAREYLNVQLLVLVSCGGPTPLAAPTDLFSLPVCLLSCLRPLLICGFKTREMFYTPRGKLIEVEKGFDVPSYVLSHTMRGQFWPEGDLSYHKQITLPTLLLHGMKDRFVSLVEMCDMEKAIPRAFLETIPNAGHMVMLEAADETNLIVGQFLDRWLHPDRQKTVA